MLQNIIPWQPAEVASRKRLAGFEAVLGFVLTCGYTRNAKNKNGSDSFKTGKTHAWVAFGEGCKEMWQKCYAVDFLLNICGCQSLFQSHELRSQHLHCWPGHPPERRSLSLSRRLRHRHPHPPSRWRSPNIHDQFCAKILSEKKSKLIPSQNVQQENLFLEARLHS